MADVVRTLECGDLSPLLGTCKTRAPFPAPTRAVPCGGNESGNEFPHSKRTANSPAYDFPGNLMLTAIPEPGAALLVLWALVCGLLVRRRRG